MSRKIIQAARISQMSNPEAGTGSGGDRCTATVGAMIDLTYKLGPKAKTAQTIADGVAIRDDLVGTQPGNTPGNPISHLENFGTWFPKWLSDNGYDKIIGLSNTHNPTWADVKRIVDAQHIAMIGVNEYGQLKAFNNTDPYQWPEPSGVAGHVLLLVGYDDDFRGSSDYGQTVIVHDPLRAVGGMPYDYTWRSLQAAGFSDLTEVTGAKLPYTTNSDAVPAPAPAPAPTPTPTVDPLAEAQAKIDAVKAWLAAAPQL